MKSTVLICTLLAISVSQFIQECPVFSCGTISNRDKNGEVFACGHPFVDSSGDTSYALTSCPSTARQKKSCPINANENPSEVLEDGNRFCVADEEPQLALAPGDKCLFADDCFPANEGELTASCEFFVCKPAKGQEGDSCKGLEDYNQEDRNKLCDVNHFCQVTKGVEDPEEINYTCQKVLSTSGNEECSLGQFDANLGLLLGEKRCEYSSECIYQKKDESEAGSYRCVQWFSIQGGNEIVVPLQLTGKGEGVPKLGSERYDQLEKVCFYNNLIQDRSSGEPKLYCMQGPQCQQSISEKQDLGFHCVYSLYHNPLNTAENTENVTQLAQCGFNDNPYAYCDMKKGDTPYLSYVALARSFYAMDFDCHVESDQGRCKAAIDKQDDQFKNFFREEKRIQYRSQPGGNANVADNDKCVKSMITKEFWQDDMASKVIICLTFLAALINI